MRKDLLQEKEKAVLVALETPYEDWDVEESLNELAALAQTAGAEVVARTIQKKAKPDVAYYLGKGKAQEAVNLAQELEADLLIFNDALSPSQLSNLNELTDCRILDRNQLILDIFAQRALSAEGKLQVELAQLQYSLPRLRGMGKVLSRLGGGIGTRGPGESKLEQDRRVIRRRIALLEKDIDEIGKRREVTKGARVRSGLPLIALVGYTNAGKSSLLNWLCSSHELAEDKLFATLDSVTRSFFLNEKQEVLLSDTVGFIHKLPTALVAAFRSTLAELHDADLLLHVVDIGDENYREQIDTTMKLLEELKLDRPLIRVFNKKDLVSQIMVDSALNMPGDSVAVSVKADEGKEELLKAIQDHFAKDKKVYSLLIPYNRSELLPFIYKEATVLEKEETELGTRFLLESKEEFYQHLIRKLGIKLEVENG